MTEAAKCKAPKYPRAHVALVLSLFLIAAGHEALAEDHPRFTLETLSPTRGPIVPKIWTVSTSIKILEPLSLSNTCDPVDGEVSIQDYGRKVIVKLKARQVDPATPPTGGHCTRTETPTAILLTIPSMPFIPGCTHSIRLETPQRIVTDTVIIDW